MRRERGKLQVLPDSDAVSHALAEYVTQSIEQTLARAERCTIALAGGNTPRGAYELLATPQYSAHIAWARLDVYFGDERCVPPDDSQSNARMANDALLSHVPIPKDSIFRMKGELAPPVAADTYAQLLRERFAGQPRLDLILLGAGPDGHTASLFPGSDPFLEDAALVRAVYVEKMSMWRITLTPRVLNAARRVAFTVTGAEKATAIAAVRDGAENPVLLPAQVIAPEDGELLWILDTSAAALTRKP